MSPEELLDEAQKNSIDILVLTDINNTSACLRFAQIASDYNIKPVLGIDFRNGVEQLYVGIAKNNEGFYELNCFLSKYLHSAKVFPEKAPYFEHAYIIYPFQSFTGKILKENEYIGVCSADVNKLKFSEWKNYSNKLIVLQTVTFRNKRDFNAHRLLRAIDNNTLLSKLPRSEEGNIRDIMLSNAELTNTFADFPYVLENTQHLLNNCGIYFEFGSDFLPKNQRYYTGSAEGDLQLIQVLCQEGLSYRYPELDKKILDRLSNELEIIYKKEFVSYFLINWDIINYARKKRYFYVGRGSGANSIVAYLLRITDVDPIELDLYFERFINLYRKNPPDFDIDFSWKDRKDVIRYIFERFPNVALLATYSTFQYRAMIREIGKVFGLPSHEIELLNRKKYQINDLDHISRLVLQYSKLIHGFPSHLSIHAGGILISEKPIQYYTATFMPPKGFPTTQFDMIVAEDAGLYKFDILSQRGLGKIKDALEIIQENNPQNDPIDIHDIQKFKEDEKVKYLLKNAKAIGCFYVESPAMRMLLKKLQVDYYLGLVAASSVIRPGVAKSGMMREYILRFRYPEKRKEVHPIMLDIMPETFGVMVYQEDVIKVAHYFAGLTLSEADVLRRGMSGKYRSREEFKKVQDKFFSNCRKKGYKENLTANIWRQIESFAGYAFAKGHSASYAVESYQSLYLKAHYPLEFMVAVINNFGGFYRTEFYIHEARMWGASIHPPCVNQSHGHTIIKEKDIFLGFMHLHEFERKCIADIIAERERSGVFKDLYDFVERVPISIEQLSILIRINAFRFTGINKHELLWKAHFKLAITKPVEQYELFKMQSKKFELPRFSISVFEDAFDQLELLGFTLYSPFMLLKNTPGNSFLFQNLNKHLGKIITIMGYLVTYKNTITSNGKSMHFGTFLDQNGNFFDTTHFPNVAEKYPFRGKGVYSITGKVVEEFEFYSIEVTYMEKENVMEDPRYSDNA